MATPTNYVFDQAYDIYSLTTAIENADIVVALDHIEVTGNVTTVVFKDTLSTPEAATLDDVVANYVIINPPPRPPAEVVTQFEKRDKTLKIAHGEADVDTETGLAEVLIKVPGTPGSSDGRWISGGVAFFTAHVSGDKILSVRFTDEDNLLGNGAGFVVGSYTDDDADEANQGWVVSPRGWLEAEAIGGYGFAPSGFYIKVIGQKAAGNYSGKFYMNIEWGKTE